MHRLDGVRNVPNVIFPRATSQVENFPNVLLPKQQLSKGLAKASEAQQAAKGRTIRLGCAWGQHAAARKGQEAKLWG